ncbi:MAG TPA: DNA repair protein RecN [Gammaproteobacteria bacterium]|jgi:DNA repair protein RecN (Recombination protein N)|nr:DNA repair protein RecN [Gammaproteobacteria bacterium]
MLTEIHIRDLATIEELHLPLKHGGSMITGETGAGKSIFIEAIELALGARGSANIIRVGKERADISLSFDISKLPNAGAWLNAHDFAQGNSECIIRRALSGDGRSRSYINGYPATQQLARELGELLFHLHGQYEQQVLLKAENQRELLDRYAGHMQLVNDIKSCAEQWKKLDNDIKQLRDAASKREERSEYLRFQLDELNTLNVRDGEWEKLEAEHHRLTHAEELLRNIQRAIALLDDGEQNVLSGIVDIRKSLEAAQNIEKKISDWLTTLNSAEILLNDIKVELSDYLESSELDPERLQFIEQRVSAIYDAARKHKIQPQELAPLQQKLQQEWDALENSDQGLLLLAAEQEKVTARYKKLATELSSNRRKVAASLEKTITKSIRALSLPHGEFHIALEAEDNNMSPHGVEKIVFHIKTNPDQKLQPLAKVISGGELSRLSLAVHLALADRISTPTLIFDEVDTGVGGATAEKIGKLLRMLGETYQIFCVTHQPQVAACGQHHILVEKSFINNSTHTTLRFLNTKERKAEVARMLGGEKITDTTLAHAEEMLGELNPA